MPFTPSYLERSEQVFLHPTPLYTWNEIVSGVSGLGRKRMSAVGTNTFRGFHRLNKTLCGAGSVFNQYFLSNATTLANQLNHIRTQEDLHEFSNGVVGQIKNSLGNIRAEQLGSYNKVRKPVDLYIEALVSMANEVTQSRATLVPLLFLPLDSQMFAHTSIFTDQQLLDNGLSRRSTFTNVECEKTYMKLQSILLRRADEITNNLGKNFSRIYFDLLWNNRYLTQGTNLFRTNPGA